MTGSLIFCVYLLSKDLHTEDKHAASRELPHCFWRPSSRIYMISMSIWEIVRCAVISFQNVYLIFLKTDVLRVFGDLVCRTCVFVMNVGWDMIAWHTACLCMERFLLTLKPNSSYAVNKTVLTPALLAVGVINVATLAANFYVLVREPGVCISPSPTEYVICRNFYHLFLPFSLLFVTIIGLLIFLLKE